MAQLGLKAINEETLTGLTNSSNDATLKSYSPVNKQLISALKSTSAEDYEKVIHHLNSVRSWTSQTR